MYDVMDIHSFRIDEMMEEVASYLKASWIHQKTSMLHRRRCVVIG
jgi:hypothetical protein